MLLANREIPADVRDDIARIRQAGEQALAMTVQLLAAGKRQPLPQVILNLNHVIADSRGLIERLLGPGIELVTAPGAERSV